MTKVGLYAIGTSTTLESNKSLREILRSLVKQKKFCVEEEEGWYMQDHMHTLFVIPP